MNIQAMTDSIVNSQEYNKDDVKSNPEIIERLANTLLQSEVFLVESEVRKINISWIYLNSYYW